MGAVHPLPGHFPVPLEPGSVGLFMASEGVRPEESSAHVVDVRLDLPFRLRTVRFAQLHPEAVVVGRGQSLRVEDLLREPQSATHVVLHDGFRAVVEDLLWHSPEMPERVAVAAPEGCEVHRADSLAKGVPRVPEDHMEAIERKGQPAAVYDRLFVRPVHLRLYSRRRLEALFGGADSGGSEIPDVPLDDLVPAVEAVVAGEILVDAGRPYPRLLLEPCLDDRLEGVELRGRPLPTIGRLLAFSQVAFDRPPVPSEHSGYLGAGETLAVQGVYVHGLLLVDHSLLRFLCVALS